MLKTLLYDDIINVNDKFITDANYLLSVLPIKKEVLNYYNNWTLINDELYYFKQIDDKEKIINELLGVYLAKYFKLKTANYILARNNSNIGLLSKSIYEKNKKYMNLFDISDVNVYGIISKECLENVLDLCKTNKEKDKVIIQILLMSILDFYSHQVDRVSQNINFEIKPHVSLAPLYDYSETFDISTYNETREYNYADNYNWFKKNRYIYGNDLFKIVFPSKNMEELFVKYPKFYENFKKILDLDLELYLKMIENDNGITISNQTFKYYMDYDKKQKEFVRKII